MIVVSLNSVPPKLRGFLTKYLWEISVGVYVGEVNPRIREALWRRIQDNLGSDGKAVMVFSAENEQGFDFLIAGSSRIPVDYEGLKLLMRPSGNSPEQHHAIQTSAGPAFGEEEYIVLDFETTGLDVDSDFILEIGAIRVADGEQKEEFNRIIAITVPDNITKLTGITQKMADSGERAEDALKELANFIGGRTVIGYNIRMFDAKILRKECARHDVVFPLKKVVDVMDIVKRKNIGIISYKMKNVAEFLEIEEEQTHRALPDCRICEKIYRWVLTH